MQNKKPLAQLLEEYDALDSALAKFKVNTSVYRMTHNAIAKCSAELDIALEEMLADIELPAE